MNFDHFFATELNQQQQKIVEQKNGVLLICAGAGSGKTRIITSRMTALIVKHHVPAHQIIALTFTNKAAREMRERMISFLGSRELPYVGTFHSYCLRLLKANSHALSIPEFSIMDDDDQEKLLKLILTRHGVHKKITPKHISSIISHLKNEAVTGELPWHLVNDQLMQSLIATYEREKTAAHCYDFDDLLLETLRLVRTNKSFKEAYQQHIRHILVDEYQDTNKVQHALLLLLTCDKPQNFALDSLCVVGDEDQSIYSWRGATVHNIVHFKKDFPTVTSFTIEQNYRSVKPILDLANQIIINNRERNPKKLWSDREARDRVRLISCISGYHEADIIAHYIRIYQAHYSEQSCAILYRSHYQSRILEEALLKEGIAYRIIGGIQFYDRQEIKDLLAYLKLIVNPYDRVSFSRIYSVPSRGLGEKFLEQFFALWEIQPFLRWDQVAEQLISNNVVTGAKAQALNTLIKIMSAYHSYDKASGTLESLMQALNYIGYLKEHFEDKEATTKIENVKELVHATCAAEERSSHLTLSSYLEEIALLQQAYETHAAENCIQLMTLHAAKGLEFDMVIITGLEEQILPSTHALASGELEEERRLLYVGITRTRERLLLTHARYRHAYGSVTEHRISRFMDEVSSHLQPTDGTQWAAYHIKEYARNWLAGHAPEPARKVTPAQATLAWAEDPFEEDVVSWRVKQKVQHKTFGLGTIEKIEEKSDDQIFLTIKFGAERKRIDARYVQAR